MTDTTIMRAAILDRPGAPFRISSVPRPEPGLGEVLVRIAASGVNPLDTKIFEGAAAHARHPLPAILGIDMAGTVEAVGAGVTVADIGVAARRRLADIQPRDAGMASPSARWTRPVPASAYGDEPVGRGEPQQARRGRGGTGTLQAA